MTAEIVSIVKQDFIDKIADACPIANSFEVRLVLEAIPIVLTELLQKDIAVNLPGIGKFVPEHKEETIRRNPKTGEKVVVAPHKVAKFKLNTKLKAAIR